MLIKPHWRFAAESEVLKIVIDAYKFPQINIYLVGEQFATITRIPRVVENEWPMRIARYRPFFVVFSRFC